MEISPSHLQFSGSFTEPTTEYLSLTNTSPIPLAYKVKTTAPKLYCVRPNASIIEPGTTVKVLVILQGFTNPLPEDYKCKDKFLIVSLPCPGLTDSSTVYDNWSSLEAEYKDQVVSKKLRVVYNINAPGSGLSDSAAVVEESPLSSASEKAAVAAGAAVSNVSPSDKAAADSIKAATDSSKFQKELDESTAEINNLNEKLDSNEKTAVKVAEPAPVSGFSVPFAIILILIAFILGWILL